MKVKFQGKVGAHWRVVIPSKFAEQLKLKGGDLVNVVMKSLYGDLVAEFSATIEQNITMKRKDKTYYVFRFVIPKTTRELYDINPYEFYHFEVEKVSYGEEEVEEESNKEED